jgi:amino acid efflux transporter
VRLAAVASLSIVIVLYTGLAICTVGVLGDTAGDTPMPLIHLLGATGKPWATGTVAVLAVLLTFGASFTFVAAGARAGVSLARHHVIPSRIAVTRQGVPRRSLAVQAAAGAVVAVTATVAPGIVTVDLLVRVFAALLACVTVVGLAAAVRLLPVARSRVSAAVAALAVAVIVAMSGPFLFPPAAIAVVVLSRISRGPSPAAAMRAVAPGIDHRAPLGDVRAPRTAAEVGIR